MRLLVEKDGSIKEGDLRKYYNLIRNWPFRWVCGQIVLSGLFPFVKYGMGIKKHWTSWVILLCQWGLLYYQCYSYGWKGSRLNLPTNIFAKWSWIAIPQHKIWMIIYKKVPEKNGTTTYWLYPLRTWKHKWKNAISFLGLKVLIILKLIR